MSGRTEIQQNSEYKYVVVADEDRFRNPGTLD